LVIAKRFPAHIRYGGRDASLPSVIRDPHFLEPASPLSKDKASWAGRIGELLAKGGVAYTDKSGNKRISSSASHAVD